MNFTDEFLEAAADKLLSMSLAEREKVAQEVFEKFLADLEPSASPPDMWILGGVHEFFPELNDETETLPE